MWKYSNKIIYRNVSGNQLWFNRNSSVGGTLSQQVRSWQKEQELLKSRNLFTNNGYICSQTQLELADSRIDEKWQKARPFGEIPGPSLLRMLSFFMPGGKLFSLRFYII